MEEYERLEHQWATFIGKEPKQVVACSSGTAALHLSLEAMQLQSFSTVLVPDFTMIACARAVSLSSLRPMFIDCNERLLIDPDELDTGLAVAEGVGAIMPVHVYGRRCGMGTISMLGKKYGVRVIEDMAEAHGVEIHPDSDAACWSFYRNKIVAGEEGGAVYFKDATRADYARSLRCLGFTEAHDFRHIARGHNYRLANSLAHLIRVSLVKAKDNLETRRRIVGWLDSCCPPSWRMPERDVCWVYDLRLPGIGYAEQDRIVNTLKAHGIQARHGFKPLSEQDEYRYERSIPVGRALKASAEVIYLPLYPASDSAENVRQTMDLLIKTVRAGGVAGYT
jgi:perosamine synthetase